MMENERPASSRPKTAAERPGTAKRPKTAGRNAERPQTRSLNAGYERPVSRKGGMERIPYENEENHQPFVERTVSRGPTSSYGGRPITGQLPTAMAGRPLTSGRAIGTGLARPVTQQGLAGVRAPTRAGTAFGSRVVMDKTYFMALLNTQLAALNEEIESLEKEMVKFEQEQQKLLIYEQKAEEQADELKRLQGELTDYNLLIDKQNTNSDLSDLQYEVQEEQAKNEELAKTVEEMFREKREKEDKARILEQQVQEIRLANEDLMNSLDPGIREEYEQIKEKAEEIRNETEEKQRELSELTKKKEEVDVALANSPLKQQAMGLQEQIAELEMKKAELVSQLNAEGTPEELRERIIEQIKKDNHEIANMQATTEEIEEKLAQAREELLEFQNEYDITAGEKNEKYRELKLKEAQIDEFLKDFQRKKHEIESKMEEENLEIVRLLQLISLNCSTINGLDTLNTTSMDESSLEMTKNPTELQELHVRLQEELIDLNQTKTRLEAEFQSMKNRSQDIQAELQSFDDVNALEMKTREKRNDLMAQKQQLESKLPHLEREVMTMKDNVEFINDAVRRDPKLQKVWSQTKLEKTIRNERDELRQKVKEKAAEVDYHELKEHAMALRKEYNAILVKAYGGR